MENLNNEKNKEVGKKKGILFIAGVAIIVATVVALFYWQETKDQIYIEKAEVSAPSIALSSSEGGTLKEIFVKVGDTVPADTVVAKIGNEAIKTSTDALIIQIKNNIGENFSPNEPVVIAINPQDLHVAARVEENKGLSDVAIGQQAVFTIDAFGSKQFSGIVDEISPTSHESGVVFNISDKREVKEFDVKIKFDEKQYPELKNGMSAKTWIYKSI